MGKNFKLKAEEIRRLIPSMGYCIASDRITVGGEKVGYMYREAPSKDGDSGWCFFSGTEPQAYVDDAANFSMYDVNTICNYDPAIIPYLGETPGHEFVRDRKSEKFAKQPLPPK